MRPVTMVLRLACGGFLSCAWAPNLSVAASVPVGTAKVLLVCNGSTEPCPQNSSTFATVQSAVDQASPGDWILVWPGVYHEHGSTHAGVLIGTPHIHLRGLDRNRVIVDGTDPLSPSACSSEPAVQVFVVGGRNGIEISKVDGVTVDNLTVCNYLSDHEEGGTQVWWNGGDGSGQIGLRSYRGSYLSATSTYFQEGNPAMGTYGIFVVNASGPGKISHSYASNMADAAFYVGACPDCNAILDHVHGQNSALGYSGTNSGGHLIIQDSEWDLNRTGIVPNSRNDEDQPSPQDGRCPGQGADVPGTRSCTLIRRNHVHHNNNPNTPTFGTSASTPIGVGIEIAGGQFDTVYNNRVEHQGSWGILVHNVPDPQPTTPEFPCTGGIQLINGGCIFNAMGNNIGFNKLKHNGFFGNPTNGDLANQARANPRNCFHDNRDPQGLTSYPANIEHPLVDGRPCSAPGQGADVLLQAELGCAAGLAALCPPGSQYPQKSQVKLLPLVPLETMPAPCHGVPANPWCDDDAPHPPTTDL